jgi:glyoxylase-like metal-dependent hydrolase (beta-lactamase superfamily II)
VSDKARVYPLNRPAMMTLSASSTLIVDGPRRIVVDSGDFATAEELDHALRSAAGLGLEAVTDVYYTHLHFDHYRPCGYERAHWRLHAPREEFRFVAELMRHRNDRARYKAFLTDTHELIAPVFLREFLRLAADPRYDFGPPEQAPRFELCDAGTRLSPHVVTVDLAGHCPGQLGLEVETGHGLCLIAGDAVISLEDFLASDTAHHLIVYNREQLLASRRRVAEADFVVPGHGGWFDPARGAPVNFNWSVLND